MTTTLPEEWSTIELFEFLQIVNIISPDDTFEMWMNDRCDLLKFTKRELDQY